MTEYIEFLESKVKQYQQKTRTAKKVLKDFNTGKYTQKQLGEKYNMTRQDVSRITQKRTQ